MSRAMQLIVAGFVAHKDHRALRGLLTHRRKVLAEIQALSNLKVENAVQAIQNELTIIEAGLEQLKPPPGTLPENEWT